jgi:Immunity protein 74
MFFVPRLNVIESDAGFSVEVLGRTGMQYREGEKTLLIDSEVLAPGRGIAVFTSSIKHWSQPYDGEPINPEKKAAIVNNIKQAMEFKKELLEIL